MEYLDKEGLTTYDAGIKKKIARQSKIIELDDVISPDTEYSEVIDGSSFELDEDSTIEEVNIKIINQIENTTSSLTLVINDEEYELTLGDAIYSFYGDEEYCDTIKISKVENEEYNIVVTKNAQKAPSGMIVSDTSQEIYNQSISINFNEGVNTISLKEFPESIVEAKKCDGTLGYNIDINYKVGNDSLSIFYCDTRMKKGIDYQEQGLDGDISHRILFLTTIGDLNMSDVKEFEDFKETLEFIVIGEYE